MRDQTLSDAAKIAWQAFLANKANLGHAERGSGSDNINKHVNDCMQSARATVGRVRKDLGELSPKVILEIGCSAGLNCFSLQEEFPEANVIGIEPEQEAVRAAESLRQGSAGRAPLFIRGVGESIPLPDRSIDLILCHTVIEHVRNVQQVISEIARVLGPDGIAHLEAPNYLWPYEPHLDVLTIPMMGKSFVEFCARLQGQGAMVPFLEHLQFVTPFKLEKLFTSNSLVWCNRAGDKIRAVLAGQGDVKQYKALSRLLGIVGSIGLAKPVTRGILASGMYPSVLYSLRHMPTKAN
jgi:ubiquinone/menaquinone biosynthesis C-methylase UbiE